MNNWIYFISDKHLPPPRPPVTLMEYQYSEGQQKASSNKPRKKANALRRHGDTTQVSIIEITRGDLHHGGGMRWHPSSQRAQASPEQHTSTMRLSRTHMICEATNTRKMPRKRNSLIQQCVPVVPCQVPGTCFSGVFSKAEIVEKSAHWAQDHFHQFRLVPFSQVKKRHITYRWRVGNTGPIRPRREK